MRTRVEQLVIMPFGPGIFTMSPPRKWRWETQRRPSERWIIFSKCNRDLMGVSRRIPGSMAVRREAAFKWMRWVIHCCLHISWVGLTPRRGDRISSPQPIFWFRMDPRRHRNAGKRKRGFPHQRSPRKSRVLSALRILPGETTTLPLK